MLAKGAKKALVEKGVLLALESARESFPLGGGAMRAKTEVKFKVQCVTCGKRSEIDADSIEPGDVPYCEKCFTPCFVLEVSTRAARPPER